MPAYVTKLASLQFSNLIMINRATIPIKYSQKHWSQLFFSLENELYICKSELGNCQIELESVKNSNIQLTEENSALQMSSKNSMSESQSLMAEMQMIKDTGRGKIIIMLA